MHTAYSHVIEKHGPKVYGTDHIERCVYVEEIEGVSFDRFVTRDINPWTAEGYSQLEQVVNSARNLMESLRQDRFTNPAGTLGYLVKPDLTVRQVDFWQLYYVGRRDDSFFEDYDNFKQILRGALQRNAARRMQSGNLSDPDYQTQFGSIPGMIDTLMP